ncbi:hypothetical protein DPMN_178564 [Dreissena polymorpha]|uniref:Uncharacterized protein n=1 Tax=Dreissena polymorpha TaxID=45954 RepID=A0A9D4ILJ3_DREPO|nr:hypothetical protein DPMN_178564 [Dreissena polymorpha]
MLTMESSVELNHSLAGGNAYLREFSGVEPLPRQVEMLTMESSVQLNHSLGR